MNHQGIKNDLFHTFGRYRDPFTYCFGVTKLGKNRDHYKEQEVNKVRLGYFNYLSKTTT